MDIRISDEGISIQCPPTTRFQEVPQCPACGYREDHWWRRFLRILRGKKPKTVVRYNFCPGQKPPTEKAHPFASLLMFGSGEVSNRCTGLEHPHLHAHCAHCGAEWFSETKAGI